MEIERPLLTQRARKLISKAVIAGIDPKELREEIADKINLAKERGSERITREDFSGLAREVRARTERLFVPIL